ncbi:MAG: zinc ribbon domain-containing protein [Ruminococcus sp.]|nr:zinc ribbon domain-containing protein [Ruminococcus sp.]
MADPIQKLKNSMNRGITTISVKTSSSLEKSKINMHIDTLEKEIQSLFFAIGSDAYNLWESGAFDSEMLTENFNSVKQKKAEIAQLNAELEAIDKRDNQILGTAAQNTAAPAPAALSSAAIFCPQCGAAYETPVKFCRKCGCNLQNI